MSDFWQVGFLDPLRSLWSQVRVLLPSVVESLLIVVIGLLLAWLFKEIVYRVLRQVHFDRLAERLGVASAVERVGGFRSTSYFVGQLVGWFIVVLTLLTGLYAFDPAMSRNLVERFLAYIPSLLVAAFILLLGVIVSRFLARGVLLAAVNARMQSAGWLAGTVRFLVMVLATVAALEHVGIGRSTVLIAFGIIFGGVVLALAIAFGLGGRDLARDLLERQFRRRTPEESENEGVRHL